MSISYTDNCLGLEIKFQMWAWSQLVSHRVNNWCSIIRWFKHGKTLATANEALDWCLCHTLLTEWYIPVSRTPHLMDGVIGPRPCASPDHKFPQDPKWSFHLLHKFSLGWFGVVILDKSHTSFLQCEGEDVEFCKLHVRKRSLKQLSRLLVLWEM